MDFVISSCEDHIDHWLQRSSEVPMCFLQRRKFYQIDTDISAQKYDTGQHMLASDMVAQTAELVAGR